MKGSKTLGMLALLLAALVLVTGIIGAGLDTNQGALGQKWQNAVETDALLSAHKTAAEKTAVSAGKKAATAVKGAADARSAVTKAQDALAALDAALADGSTGDGTVDTLLGLSASAEDDGVRELADSLVLGMYEDIYTEAQKSVSGANDKCVTASEGIAAVYEGIGLGYDAIELPDSAKKQCDTPADCIAAVEQLSADADALAAAADTLTMHVEKAQKDANAVCAADSMDAQSRFLVFAQTNWIGFVFTALVLALAGIVLLFFAKSFGEKWKKVPVFSTALAALVMVAIQTYALGFRFDTIGAWLMSWFNNAMNVLRANSSVGMIALSMTFVIISGGIDLAVGSTLAGISTVVMCLIDAKDGGVLTAMGITGMPAYLIACAAGILAGLLMGALTGAIVTKGKVPPFIVTLGMMQLIRSIAQYFTKSYTPEVPKAFQAMANSVIGGQMLLPIVYWLVLAVILHFVSRNTAFGRHVYAVGSNERTTMLSGINVNKVKMKVYILSGLVVSLAAILQVSRLRGVDVSSAGNGYEMNAIAAVVVGGTSMAGGKGSIFGTVLGVLIIGIMNNLLVLLSVDSFLSSAFTGAIVIAAVLMQRKENA